MQVVSLRKPRFCEISRGGSNRQICVEARGGIGAFTQGLATIVQNALPHIRRYIFMARFLAARHELPARDRKHGGGRRFEECLAVLHILETALFIDTSL